MTDSETLDWNLENFHAFWTHIEVEALMTLFDRPLPTLVFYSHDLLERGWRND